MKDLIVYVHGKGGSAEEAEHYAMLFPNHEVIGFDYKSQTPWEAKKDRTPEEDDMLDMMLHGGERVRIENLSAVLDWYNAQQ